MRRALSAMPVLLILLLSVSLGLAAGCGDDDGGDDAADVDAGVADAGLPPDGALPTCGDTAELLTCLTEIPGVVNITELEPSDPTYRWFHIGVEQPLDHENPGAGSFVQYLNLIVRELGAPTVLATSESYWKTNPTIVRKMHDAVKQGWTAYLANPAPANELMAQLNQTMDAQTFIESAEAQKPLIETDETRKLGLGAMTESRWKTLIGQLLDLKVIDKPLTAEECFLELNR